MKNELIRRIYQECFDDSPRQVSLFFDRVYREEDGMLLNDDQGRAVSALVLRQLPMSFHGSEVSMGYVCGAATLRKNRGQGLMSQLMHQALHACRERGDMLCTLIPANDALYFFYRRFGFAAVFYYKEQRYTSLHSFPTQRDYHSCELEADKLFPLFDQLQRLRPCAVLHDEADFAVTIEDCRADGGTFVAVRLDGEEEPSAMAWGVPRQGVLVVTDAVGIDEDAVTAALRMLRASHNEMPVLVLANPNHEVGGRLMPHAMGRIVNPQIALEKIAAENPKWKCRLRVRDSILGDADYVVQGGQCVLADADDTRHPDFDVRVEVLTQIVFSSPKIGEVLDFPSVRPSMNLMMD